jgi:hypothetical protein
MDITSDEYILYALQGAELSDADVTLAGLLNLLTDYYHPAADVMIKTIALFGIVVGVYAKTGVLPQPLATPPPSDELLLGAANLVYADTDYTWANIGNTARTMLNDMLKGEIV